MGGTIRLRKVPIAPQDDGPDFQVTTSQARQSKRQGDEYWYGRQNELEHQSQDAQTLRQARQLVPPDKGQAASKQDKHTLAHGERQTAHSQNRIIRLKTRRNLIPRVAHRIGSFLRGSKNQFEKFRSQVDRKHHNRKAAN
jgi:hypothetical protein